MEDLTHSTDLAFRRMAKESDEILNTILAPGHPTGGVSSDRPICPRTACQSLPKTLFSSSPLLSKMLSQFTEDSFQVYSA